jgi:cbb3-type cytochrome oxidase subunit 3
MIQNVLRDIGGIGIYGVVSICLFFLVFTGVLLWSFRLKKPFLKSMSSLPLDDEEVSPVRKGEYRHG